jgi:hypothetical protein
VIVQIIEELFMPKESLEPKIEDLASSELYMAWKAEEPDGEVTYHLELNNVTLHFFQDEWDEFLELMRDAMDEEPDEDGTYPVQFDNVTVVLLKEEWQELLELMRALL